MVKMNRVVFWALVAVMFVGGCHKGMKVTFINHTNVPVETEFFTQGGPDHQARTTLGAIGPGESESVWKQFDEELLPCGFSITIFPASNHTLTRIIQIPKKYPPEIRVDIKPDGDLYTKIEVYDDKDMPIPAE